MWVGIGVGIGRNRFATGIFNAYALRVTADGGITEAGACVDAVSGLLLSASLLLIPSGYKGGKLYAEIPTNGNGDLTWTRGSDAFRTNASGLIQRVPWNLVQYSEQFENAAWTKFDTTVTANATISPNGTTTADKLVESATTNVHWLFQSTTTTSSLAMSCYMKKGERDWGLIRTRTSLGDRFAWFNLNTGVVGTVESSITASITNVGDGWYRCIVVSANPTTSANPFVIGLSNADNVSTYTGNGTSGIFIWGAQLVEGTTAQTYLPTTDRLNFPRLDYTYGSCPAVLLEPQRTNLVFNSGWTGGGATPTGWTLVVGSGTSTPTTSIKNTSVTAYRFTGTLQRQIFVQTYSATSGVTYSMSIYVESVTTTAQVATVFLPSGTGTSLYYKDGLAISATDNIVAGSKYTCVFVATATSTVDWRFGLGCNGGVTADFVLSMPQVEVGAYATTFILSPVGATATRVADSFSRNNIYTNGLITSSGGTWFVEFKNNISYLGDAAGDNIILGVSTLVSDNCLRFNSPFSSSSRIAIAKRIGGVTTVLYTTTTNTCKIAMKWDGSVLDIFENGVKVISGSSFTEKNMEFISNGFNVAPKFIQSMALFPTPLTDTQCQTLTTI